MLRAIRYFHCRYCEQKFKTLDICETHETADHKLLPGVYLRAAMAFLNSHVWVKL